MIDKLKEIEQKYNEIDAKMQDPEYYSDPAAYAKLAREQKEISPVVEAYRRYAKAKSDADGAMELMSDPDFKELAQEEYEDAKKRMETLEE
ncbi:MAG: PCRF domain-containing protein, partial [Oscillospiraceae bacterium]|nr:PCRF domain-containing protein [Oscillospiraceae bacterium]